MSDNVQRPKEETQGEGQLPAATPTAQEPQVLEDEEKEALENSKNPERTASYIKKLKDKLREKEEKVTELESGKPRPPSILDTYLTGLPQDVPPPQPAPYYPPAPQIQTTLPQTKVDQIRQQVIDQDGYVNAEEFERRLKSAEIAEQRAREAENRANQALDRIARFEADTQAKELYKSFPQLDPDNDGFNQEFYDEVSKEMLVQQVRTGRTNPIEAATKMSRFFVKPSAPAAPTPAQEARSHATAPPRGSGRASTLNALTNDELRERSLIDPKAMEERIRRSGI